MSGEADEPATVFLRDEYLRRYGKLLSDGWILVDYTDDGKGQRVRAFESMIAFDSIMIGSFSIAITLAALTYKHISKADKLASGLPAVQTVHCCVCTDYREGILSIIRPKTKIIQVETTWRTNEVTAITPTAS
ncbi:hypothetical protein PRIPAC_81872 [Pristionchus pacificus]|uniref:Uncharacterized protein n=1 Tax=Pristionchus pacificus TaxID=54126 RepID=A0A2A6CPN7_PRIPA|nr:hypothetical protein PRIPAC_81872 [Pristionchus pacificus]|eukprot:PDM80066.1 hypothetical protein PRIPAC_32645 [Pristionchus pacificus]